MYVCVCVRPFYLSSISHQPRRGAFQGFDEGLQQERPAHGEERRHHSGGHQDDSHQPHLSGESSPGWSFLFNTRGWTGPTVNAAVLKYLSSEWKGGGADDKCLDRTGKSARTSSDGSVRCLAVVQCICQMLSNTISACSNGVTTGSDGTSRPGLLCMGTSANHCGSPPRASGCRTSSWRTSESSRLPILT